MNYRNLTQQEIELLEKQGCICEDWKNVTVKNGFATKQIRNTTFSGNVQLGNFTGKIKTEFENIKLCGLYNSNIYDC